MSSSPRVEMAWRALRRTTGLADIQDIHTVLREYVRQGSRQTRVIAAGDVDENDLPHRSLTVVELRLELRRQLQVEPLLQQIRHHPGHICPCQGAPRVQLQCHYPLGPAKLLQQPFG